MEPLTASEIAALVGGQLEGDPARRLVRVQDLRDAGPDDVAFFTAHPGLGGRGPGAAERAEFAACRAGLLLLEPGTDAGGRPCVRVKSPTLAATILTRHFHGLPPRNDPPTTPPRGPVRIHPQALVEEGVMLGAACVIGPGCVVRAGAVIGAGVVLSERVSVGKGAEVGERTQLGPGAVLYPGVRIGARCTIHANAVIGAPGFGYAWDGKRHLAMPQSGGVQIGDEVEIGAGTCVDSGTFRPTVIGAGAILDNLVQVGHNVQIGRAAVLCGQVGVSGGAKIGDGVIVGGQAGITGHVSIGAGAIVGGTATVGSDIRPGAIVQGMPAVEIGLYHRMQATLRRLARQSREGAQPAPDGRGADVAE
jgi:UDP-3-O-[3-hydroxymyristoyl] glucosamine N-acyltransferase